jgi:hypothetical protein
MWWILIIACLLMVFIYLLFAPFFVEINSVTGLFRIRFHRLASARLILNESSIFLELKIGVWQKKIDVLEKKERKKKPVVKNEKKKQTNISFQKFLAVIKSFRVRNLLLTLDTGDTQMNGILYPLFVLMSISCGKNITINFLDENKLILQIENNLARIIWAYIKP